MVEVDLHLALVTPPIGPASCGYIAANDFPEAAELRHSENALIGSSESGSRSGLEGSHLTLDLFSRNKADAMSNALDRLDKAIAHASYYDVWPCFFGLVSGVS